MVRIFDYLKKQFGKFKKINLEGMGFIKDENYFVFRSSRIDDSVSEFSVITQV